MRLDTAGPTNKSRTFHTGRELNDAARSFSFSPFDNYALIWFGRF
jgi:hypothetical protein